MKARITALLMVLAPVLCAAQPFNAKVIGISDGDTLTVLNGMTQTKIRIAAIDAPEKAQAFGQQAKIALSNLCFGKVATIDPVTTDRYGRTVADITCDRVNVGNQLILTGFAWVYDQYVANHGRYYDAQNTARLARAGLWSDANPIPPWDWRKSKRSANQISF